MVKVFPTKIEQFDDTAINKNGRDRSVAVFFSRFVHHEKDRPLDFGQTISHIGNMRISTCHLLA